MFLYSMVTLIQDEKMNRFHFHNTVPEDIQQNLCSHHQYLQSKRTLYVTMNNRTQASQKNREYFPQYALKRELQSGCGEGYTNTYIFCIEFPLPPPCIPEILTHLSTVMTNVEPSALSDYLCLLQNHYIRLKIAKYGTSNSAISK